MARTRAPMMLRLHRRRGRVYYSRVCRAVRPRGPVRTPNRTCRRRDGAVHSNQAVAAALHRALEAENVNPAAVTLIPTTNREAVQEMLTFNEHIGLVIPRGGEGHIPFVDETGISTTKRHAYGPMALEALTTEKFVVYGEGETRHPVEQ